MQKSILSRPEGRGLVIIVNFEGFAETSKIPEAVLRKIFTNGLVEDSLSEADIIGLKFLERIWGNDAVCHVWIRRYLIKKSKKAREAFLNTADLETKWERYAFSRFLNNDTKQSGRNLRMSTVVDDLKNHFNFEPNHFQLRQLYAVREKAYNLRKKKKKEDALLVKQRN
jgi:hypothetical protein